MSDAVVGWYGKVPLSREFLRRHASGEEVIELDAWMQEGLRYTKSQLGSEWTKEYSEGDPWNFFYYPRGGGRLLVGTFAPNCDEVGREFPFFVFLRIEVASCKGNLALIPYALNGFLHEARRIVKEGWVGKSLEEFTQQMETLSGSNVDDMAESQAGYHQYLVNQTAHDFWTAILGDFEHVAKYQIENGLKGSRDSVLNRPEETLAWGLKFPLMPFAQDETFDLPYWQDLTMHWIGLHQRPTVLLWNRQPSTGNPTLLINFGRPSPRLLMFIFRPHSDHEAWFDLSPNLPSQSKEKIVNRSSQEQQQRLEDKDLTLEGLLQI